MVHKAFPTMSRNFKSTDDINSTISHFNNTNVSRAVNKTISNLTDMGRGYTTAERVEICFLIILMVVILFGNSVVCCAFSTVERTLKTVTNYFVINLAVSDILVGTFSVSLWLCLRSGTLEGTRTILSIYNACDILCGSASILNLTLISVERTMAVVFPAKHRNLSRNRPIIYGGIASVWVVSLALAVLFGFVLSDAASTPILALTIIIFVIPTVIIVFSYVTIFYVVRTREHFHHTLKYEVRLTAMIGIVIVLFLLCWFPFFLFNLLSRYCSCWDKSYRKFIPAIKFLHYSNSTMNPVIYAYRNSDYRRALKKLLYKVFTCGNLSRFETRSERAMSGRSTLASQAHSAYRETVLEAKDSAMNGTYTHDCEHSLLDAPPYKN